MSRLRPLVLAGFALLALCAFTSSAVAKTRYASPVADCKANDGQLTQKYTTAELQKSLKTISPSIKEYTTCYSVIQNQIDLNLGTKSINPGGSGSGGGGSGTVILIVVIVVVVLLGGGGAFWAYRRNQAAGPGESDPGAPA